MKINMRVVRVTRSFLAHKKRALCSGKIWMKHISWSRSEPNIFHRCILIMYVPVFAVELSLHLWIARATTTITIFSKLKMKIPHTLTIFVDIVVIDLLSSAIFHFFLWYDPCEISIEFTTTFISA